ncbi:MAG: hypothetical protein KJP00_03810 [Bacteroidia bacterium]|nr:hypothetical protein [Bacteroidia bacterium]
MSFLSRLFKNKRGEQIKALAFPLGMKYSEKDEFGLIKLMGDFQLFKTGYSKKIKNILRKKDDWLQSDIAIFDYQYTVSTGKSSVTYKQTVFFINSKDLALPQFLLKPEHFFHRIGKFLNLTQDIEFETYPEFSKKYLVQGEVPSMVKDMVPEELATFFSVEKKWSLEGIHYYLIFYALHKQLPPETIEEFYKKGLKIVKLLGAKEAD